MRYTKIPNAWREVCKSTKCGVLPKSWSQHSDVEPRVHQIFKKEVEKYLEQTSVVCFSFGFVSSNCVVHGCRISSVCSLFCSWEQSLAHSMCLRNYSESIKHQCFQLTFCFELFFFFFFFFFNRSAWVWYSVMRIDSKPRPKQRLHDRAESAHLARAYPLSELHQFRIFLQFQYL